MSAALVLLTLALAAPPPPGLASARCGTPWLLQTEGQPSFEQLVPPPIRKDGTKTERDAYGAFPNSLLSDNFALKWGNTGSITVAEAQPILDAFELAWAQEVVAMGFPPPPGAETTLFNVYIGDTGNGAPDSLGTGGYFYVDPEGWPMVVLSPGNVLDPYLGQGTVGHEFFHAVQSATGNFPYEGVSAWYVEATAEWMAGQVFGDPYSFSLFLFGYALYPHYSVNHFVYAQTGAIEELHQYGAFIFPHYLSERSSSWQLIRDSWLHNQPTQDPLVVLDTLFAAEGGDLKSAFGAMAAANATWDYDEGEQFAYFVDYYASQYPTDDHRVVATVGEEGTAGLVGAPAATRPRRYAYNLVQHAAIGGGTVTVGFAGDPAGAAGSAADWRVTVVRESAPPTYHPLDLDEAFTGEVTVEAGAPLTLAVAAVPDDAGETETFGYAYRFEVNPPAGDGDGDGDGDAPGDGDGDGDGDTAGDGDGDGDLSGDGDGDGDRPDPEPDAVGGCRCAGEPVGPGLPGTLASVGLLLLGGWRRRSTKKGA